MHTPCPPVLAQPTAPPLFTTGECRVSTPAGYLVPSTTPAPTHRQPPDSGDPSNRRCLVNNDRPQCWAFRSIPTLVSDLARQDMQLRAGAESRSLLVERAPH